MTNETTTEPEQTSNPADGKSNLKKLGSILMNKDWINVKDKLPPHEDAVLTFNEEYVSIAAYWGGSWIDTVHGESNVTHWMELPELPNIKLTGLPLTEGENSNEY